jgi:glucose/mannose transport system substrate-binding protein
MMKRRSGALVVCLALAVAGCGSNSDDGGNHVTNTTKSELGVFSWWVAPGEAEALRALFETYNSAYPNVRVAHDDNTSAATWQTVLSENIANPPWDVFQISASDIGKFSEDHPGTVTPVSEYYEEPSLKTAVIPEIRGAATVNGVPMGIVTGVHRNNSFLFNKQILDAHGITAPQTLAEFLDACVKLKAAGVTPVATTFQSWALRIMFDEILAGTMGAEAFSAFLKSDAAPTDPSVKASITSAIDTFDLILTQYVDVNASKADSYGWAEAAQALHEGDAAMFLHGDWAKGYLVSLGFTPGVDFGVSGPPGAADLFVYGADMFSLAEAAAHPGNAHDFLKIVASKAGQVAFNRRKGSTPMRTDVRDQLDEPGKLALDNLMHAKVLMKGHANTAWDDAIAAYAKDGDKAALLQVYLTATP